MKILCIFGQTLSPFFSKWPRIKKVVLKNVSKIENYLQIHLISSDFICSRMSPCPTKEGNQIVFIRNSIPIYIAFSFQWNKKVKMCPIGPSKIVSEGGKGTLNYYIYNSLSPLVLLGLHKIASPWEVINLWAEKNWGKYYKLDWWGYGENDFQIFVLLPVLGG